ncbi:MAG: three-Cys-motif partner protein TcmP [Chloroflexota bacterium]
MEEELKMTLKFDEIGYWSEIKLDIIKRYASEYSKIMSKQHPRIRHHVYIDAFAGSGKNISKTTRNIVSGSPEIALNIQPPFKEFYFIDIDCEKVANLKKLASGRPEVNVLEGDCNLRLLEEVFPQINYRDFRRGLCLLDPYGLDLKWEVIKKAGNMQSIEIFLNFPVMAMNRSVLWTKNTSGIAQDDIARMDAFWGDNSWREVVYSPIIDMFGDTHNIKEPNKAIAMVFRDRLKDVAGFKNVPEPLPMRNTTNSTMYYLFFASQNDTDNRIVNHIFNKYRNQGL